MLSIHYDNMKDYAFLLNRPEHNFDQVGIDAALEGKRILVTGAGGTIGSALVRRLVDSPAVFVGCAGHSELPLFNLKNELDSEKLGVAVVDIAHEHVMRGLIERWAPDIIFHAAAFKHVGLMERQPEQAFANNSLATLRLAKVALESNSVRKFVFISTDKAVNPTSVMGASKRVAEVGLRTHFSPFATVCRFGNVLGSSGSLVEIAERKFAAHEPVIITDANMQRFFITAKEAVGLVLTAGLLEEGTCFSIDMGEPVKIMDVVTKLAPKGARFDVSKPGSGEKLTEEIIGPREHKVETKNPAVIRISTLSNSLVDEAIVRIAQNPSRLVEEARAL